jgi:hypothetical protein
MTVQLGSSSDTRCAREWAVLSVAAYASLAFFLLGLVGCGSSGLVPSPESGGASAMTATTAATKGSTVSDATPTGTSSGGASLKPCPDGVATVDAAGTPVTIFSMALGQSTQSVPPGALVQVQLSAAQLRWEYGDTAPAASLLQPAGYEDIQRQVCVWNFRAPAAGTLTLKFTGTSLCKIKGSCPVAVIRETFTIEVA